MLKITSFPYSIRSSQVLVGGCIGAFDAFQIFSFDERLNALFHHVDIGLETLSQLADDFGEEELMGEDFAGSGKVSNDWELECDERTS